MASENVSLKYNFGVFINLTQWIRRWQNLEKSEYENVNDLRVKLQSVKRYFKMLLKTTSRNSE